MGKGTGKDTGKDDDEAYDDGDHCRCQPSRRRWSLAQQRQHCAGGELSQNFILDVVFVDVDKKGTHISAG